MDNYIYRQIFGKFTESAHVVHHNYPCHNLVSFESLRAISENFNCNDSETEDISKENITSFPFLKNFDYKVDACFALSPGSSGKDRANQLVIDKLRWSDRLKSAMPRNKTKVKKYLRDMKKGISKQKLNTEILKYLKTIKNDPEQHFNGDYNWLYTGGNIAIIKQNDHYTVFGADEAENSAVLNYMQFDSEFNTVDTWEKQNPILHYPLHDKSPILQVLSCKTNDSLMVATRQKKFINILEFDNNERVRELWRNWRASDGILTSCDLSSDGEKLAVVNSFGNITSFDIDVEDKVFVYNDNEVRSSEWSQVIFNDLNNMIYEANRCVFRIFDLRVKPSRPDFTYNPASVVHGCEKLCNLIKSYFTNNIYIATSHSLLQVDVRNGKTVQKWTHLMSSAPQFGKTCRWNDEELIVLQSNNPDEVIGIVNECIVDDRFYSRSNPCVFSNAKESLRISHYNGICLQPCITERFNFTVTGLEMTEDFGNINICTINGGYDIFRSKLRRSSNYNTNKNEKKNEEEILKSMRKFEEHFSILQSEPVISASEICDMNHVVSELVKKDSELEVTELEDHGMEDEKFVLEDSSYKTEILAVRFLQVWDVELQTSDDEERGMDSDEDIRIGAKVNEWLEKYDI